MTCDQLGTFANELTGGPDDRLSHLASVGREDAAHNEPGDHFVSSGNAPSAGIACVARRERASSASHTLHHHHAERGTVVRQTRPTFSTRGRRDIDHFDSRSWVHVLSPVEFHEILRRRRLQQPTPSSLFWSDDVFALNIRHRYSACPPDGLDFGDVHPRSKVFRSCQRNEHSSKRIRAHDRRLRLGSRAYLRRLRSVGWGDCCTG